MPTNSIQWKPVYTVINRPQKLAVLTVFFVKGCMVILTGPKKMAVIVR